MFDRFGRSLSPGKGSMAGDQDAGCGNWIDSVLAESPNDDRAGAADVAAGNFLGGEGLGDRDRAVKVVGMGGAEAGDGFAGLRPGGGELRMGMDDAADLGKFAIEQGMGVEVARGAQ